MKRLIVSFFALAVLSAQAASEISKPDIVQMLLLMSKYDIRFDAVRCDYWTRYIAVGGELRIRYCLVADCNQVAAKVAPLPDRMITYGDLRTGWGMFFTNAAVLTVQDTEWCKG